VNKHIRDWDASRDVVQTTFLKVWKNWNTFKHADSQKQYLFRAVKNTMIDHVKKEKKLDISEEGFQGIPSGRGTELDSYLIRSEIMRSLNKLKPKNRKIFLLNKIEGLTYPEIAQFLDISERTVEDNMSRAFKALRQDLGKNKNLFNT